MGGVIAGAEPVSVVRTLWARIAFAYVTLIVVAITAVGILLPRVDGNRQRLIVVVTAAALAALAAVAIGVAEAKAITRPLNRLRLAAAALARGAIDERVEAGGSREVVALVAGFNEMAERLHDAVDDLIHERSRLEALLAAGADVTLALDHGATVRYLNPAATALFGQAIGKGFTETARNHELSGLVRRSAASGSRESAAVQIGAADRWYQATAGPITGGGDWSLLLILQDITEIRRAETTRRDFVANVSHELRTPLAGIKAVVETLRDGAIDDQGVRDEFLGRVDGEVDRLVQLVEELLQLSRLESGAAPMTLVEISPRGLLTQCVERFGHQAERAGVELLLDVPDLPPIRADPERLGQAAGNLIHNAIKFTPAGGRVTVSARAENGAVRIEVSDTGTGIDPADLPRIFERFYIADRARSGRGTGLGLAIVKHVVRAHGGSVDVESALGRGSTFAIELPVGE
jgi:two-component system, OmpR family, phosphate regulon sensor histidine kinase PhoR